jgi:hypothetical protein
VNYTVAVHGETATDEFLAGNAVALKMSAEALGPVFSGAEE